MKISYRIMIASALMGAAPLMGEAQNTQTPYSMYGYGILSDNATSMQRQMGSVGYAMNSGRQINVMNPASYASCDSLTFLWDMGADITFIHSKEGTVKENRMGGGLDYLTMQFPLSRHFGGSIGLLPVTSVGYAFGNEIKHGAMENQGSGGINQLYLGLATNYYGAAIGFNISYMFGNIVNSVYSTPTGSNQTLFEHVMEVRDWNINIGAQYTARLSKWDRLTVGLTWQPKKTYLGKTWVTNQNLGDTKSKPDTVASSRLRNRYYQPNSLGIGVSYSHTRQSHFMIEIDASRQDWSKADYPALYNDKNQIVFEGMKFNDRFRGALGVEYTPKLRGNYFQRITYRLGGYFTKDYLNINGNQVKEHGLTCGLGLPTPEGRTLINLGFEWKHRAASPQKLISENYFNITLGVNFNEMWFWQRKIK